MADGSLVVAFSLVRVASSFLLLMGELRCAGVAFCPDTRQSATVLWVLVPGINHLWRGFSTWSSNFRTKIPGSVRSFAYSRSARLQLDFSRSI